MQIQAPWKLPKWLSNILISFLMGKVLIELFYNHQSFQGNFIKGCQTWPLFLSHKNKSQCTETQKAYSSSMLLTLRPLNFLMSAIPFPQIFQVCTTVILLSIMWFLCFFTYWVQASQIMRSMCRENMLLKNTYISFICITEGGEIICPYQKDQNVKFAMGYRKEKKDLHQCLKLGGSYCYLKQHQ